jgi:hypothetical protein
MKNETQEFDNEEQAAAVLLAGQLRHCGVVLRADADGELVRLYVGYDGCNFMNVNNAFDIDICEIGPLSVYNSETKEKAPEGTEVFANMIVRGVRDEDTEGFGYGTPTHADGRAEATLRDPDELDEEIRRAAEVVGIYDG